MTLNPHEPGTPEHLIWNEGYQAGIRNSVELNLPVMEQIASQGKSPDADA